ncbi:hypothetical protein [Methylobacterium sp. NEAU K]|uniref:hypothetical protein n=1 Tax=Methylobacterium sp. NEAU K TaxID=3064946 RepID=UPI002735425B|nr:hypothetical protein [Methylobacterium sp. NEAU K]MDP4005121.1 hypothetical protein [Methylobacterium sp. NEAU K]
MIHYHGTPITPVAALYQLAGRHFCVSHARPEQVGRVHEIGQSVMLDNGAFSKWKRGAETDWPAFYAWCDRWLGFPTTWAVIPDVIDGGSQLQDALLREWPFGHRGAPVWHMDEPLPRLLRLCSKWPRVCIGSTAEYRKVMSDLWRRRMDECWNALAREHRHLPWVHMLRGMQCSGEPWPFASADSTDIAQNHWRPQNTPRGMADGWDALQTPGAWSPRPEQMELGASFPIAAE